MFVFKKVCTNEAHKEVKGATVQCAENTEVELQLLNYSEDLALEIKLMYNCKSVKEWTSLWLKLFNCICGSRLSIEVDLQLISGGTDQFLLEKKLGKTCTS